MTAHKSYAAAVVAIFVYVLNGIITGEWADLESIAPALAIVVFPLVVWLVPNLPKGTGVGDPLDPNDYPHAP